jgi:cell wall-associated NlpC family hydrolase
VPDARSAPPATAGQPTEPAVPPELPPAFPGAIVPAPKPPAPTASVDSYALVGTALGLRGIPYRSGGSDPTGFDCSGFTQFVFAKYGVTLPRDVRSQFRFGTPIEPNQLAPGDLVFFTTTNPDVSHVAIAIGGDEFVHAPSTWGTVRVEHLSASYWSQRYVGARRVN